MQTKEKLYNRPLYDDLLFKECFSKEENRIYLEYFLETMLNFQKGLLHNKLQVFYESPIDKQNFNDKSFRGDLLVHFASYIINIECFSKFDKESLEKTMCYAMRLASNTKKSQSYKSMKKVIQIVLVKDMQIKFSKQFSNKYLITNTKNILDTLNKERFQIFYFRLDNLTLDNVRTSNYNEDIKLRWLKFIGANTEKERKTIAKGDQLLMKFNENIEEYALDEYSKELFREWDRDIYRHRAERAERAEKEAKRKIKIAEKTSMLKLAKNLLKENVSIDFISRTTGLKKQDIQKLIN